MVVKSIQMCSNDESQGCLVVLDSFLEERLSKFVVGSIDWALLSCWLIGLLVLGGAL